MLNVHIKTIGHKAWSFQDLMHDFIKTKLDIGGRFNSCLKEQIFTYPMANFWAYSFVGVARHCFV
jgi:hypothetical protein